MPQFLRTFSLKIWSGFTISILCVSTGALAIENPEELCDRGCTEKMAQILADFQSAAFEPSFSTVGYSGSCYHVRRGLDPEHEHYGAITLTERSPLLFSGLFTFFGSKNPYEEMSFEELDAYMSKRSSRKHEVETTQNFQEIFLPSESANITYWIKTSGPQAWLLSEWDYKHSSEPEDTRIFCTLHKRHLPQESAP